jgi:hypothetical protein
MLFSFSTAWLDAILNNPLRTSAVELTSTMATVLLSNTKTPVDLLSEINKEIDGTIVFLSNQVIMVAHHVCDLGSTRAVPQCVGFAIDGFALNSPPLNVDSSILAPLQDGDSPILAPDGTTLLAIKTPTHLNASKDAIGEMIAYMGPGCFLVPPALIQVCAGHEGNPPATLFLAVVDAIIAIRSASEASILPPEETDPPAENRAGANPADEDENGDWIKVSRNSTAKAAAKGFTSDSERYYISFLSFLWLAAMGKIPNAPVSNAKDPIRIAHHKSLVDRIKPSTSHGTNPLTPLPPIPPNSIPLDSVF